MPLLVKCPVTGCNAASRIDDSLNGRPVRCPKCGGTFVPRATIAPASMETSAGTGVKADKGTLRLPAEFGRYRLLKLLGRGGMGAVYLAEDSTLHRKVALKMPFLGDKPSPQRVERFVREARAAAAVTHANICTIYDAGEIGGRPFLTMAYVEGETLAGLIDPEKPMPQRQAAEITRKIALALAHAHGADIVHRDLKPGNVMMCGGEPVVMDFGLAKKLGDSDEAKLTRAGGMVGTPAYMSPEQVGGADTVGPSTDVYALGVMLFEMLTGRVPFSGSIEVVIGRILAAPVPPVGELRTDVDVRLAAIVAKATAKKVAERYAGMGDFAAALDAYLNRKAPPPVPSRAIVAAPMPEAANNSPFGGLEPEAKPAKRRRPRVPSWMVAVGLALLVPLVGLAALTVLRVETKDGTLVVEMDGDEVETRVKGGKLVLLDADGRVKYTLSAAERSKKMDAGAYKVRVEGADGLALDTDEFTLRKGDRVTIRVKTDPKAVAKKEPEKTKSIDLGGGVKLGLVLVPKGMARLGGGGGTAGTRLAAIIDDFYLGRFEVTQDQWNKVMGGNPSAFSREGLLGGSLKDVAAGDIGEFPVESVTWKQANEFVAKLNEQVKVAGWTFRLPREVEWEYACRGGPARDIKDNTFDFYFDAPTARLEPRLANYAHASKIGRPAKVGSFPANRLGLHDMHGNVQEWMLNPAGDAGGQIVGGSWSQADTDCVAKYRGNNGAPNFRSENIGLRVGLFPVRTTPYTDREAATYMLSIGGSVITSRSTDRIGNIGDLPSGPFGLVEVNLDSNNLVCNDDLAVLQGNTTLKRLLLNRTAFTDPGMLYLEKCSALEDLQLWCVRITNLGLQSIGQCRALKVLGIEGSWIEDLSPLEKLKLRSICIKGCRSVRSLAPLSEMTELESIECTNTGISTLQPLAKMKLKFLSCCNIGVTDLGPIKNMPLTTLLANGLRLQNLDPLKDLPLETLRLFDTFKWERDADTIRAMKSLKDVDGVSPAEFLKRSDPATMKK